MYEGQILDDLDPRGGEHALTTTHCAANTDDHDHLGDIAEGLVSLEPPVIFPAHPRAERALEASGLWSRLADTENVVLMEPIGCPDFVHLFDGTGRVVTDPGGVQKEAFYPDTRCSTLRGETE